MVTTWKEDIEQLISKAGAAADAITVTVRTSALNIAMTSVLKKALIHVVLKLGCFLVRGKGETIKVSSEGYMNHAMATF
jgi:hypothetical protein